MRKWKYKKMKLIKCRNGNAKRIDKLHDFSKFYTRQRYAAGLKPG